MKAELRRVRVAQLKLMKDVAKSLLDAEDYSKLEYAIDMITKNLGKDDSDIFEQIERECE